MRLHVEFRSHYGPVQGMLDLLSLDEDALDTTHGIEQVLYQKGFLDFNRERTEGFLLVRLPTSASNPGILLSW